MLLQAAQRQCYAQISGAVCAWCRRFAANAASAPVVIVGAGPTGLTLSKLLSQYGVKSLVLERAPTVTTHPQVPFNLIQLALASLLPRLTPVSSCNKYLFLSPCSQFKRRYACMFKRQRPQCLVDGDSCQKLVLGRQSQIF